jgi:tetratricopeptide (TPR) repeat protein
MDAAAQQARTLEELMQVDLPDSVWDGRNYTNIYCAIIFADLENSVQMSRILSPADYDELVDIFQEAMLRTVGELRKQLGLAGIEFSVAGDQLALFLYDEASVKRNFLLDREPKLGGAERDLIVNDYRQSNENLAYNAALAAVYLKNSWLTTPINVERVVQHREPYGLAIGVHFGKVFLRNRPDGRRRLEGYALNMAKRIESFSRQGRFSRIMFSKDAANIISGLVRGLIQGRQRVFFHRHQVDEEILKGLGRTEVFELKFIHNVSIVKPTPELAKFFSKLFAHDDTNIWAYYQLSSYYALVSPDWDKAEHLAQKANLAYPDDEKVLLDLSKCYINKNMLDQGKEYCLRALSINPHLDLAYENLALIMDQQHDYAGAVEIARKALILSPLSPINQMNVALALADIAGFDEAVHHFHQAVLSYPEFLAPNSKFKSVIAAFINKLSRSRTAVKPLRPILQKYGPEYLALLRSRPAKVAKPG